MLKPTTQYIFSEADLQFILELAKVGHVNLLSSQVSFIALGSSSSKPHFSFKDYGCEVKCDGLQMPPNWVIEGIYTGENTLKITFGVSKVTAEETAARVA